MNSFELMLAPATETKPRYGEASVITLTNGDLFIVYSEFYTPSRGDMGAAHVLARRSKDRGRTWSEPVELIANTAITTFSVSLLRLPSGRILLAYLRKEAVTGGVECQGVEGTNCRPWFRYSDDDAKSWSELWVMDALDEKEYWCFNNDRLVRHSSGRLLFPGAPVHPRGDRDPYHSSTVFTYSDDEGRTWKKSRTELTLESIDGLQEPCVVELKDGSLMMFMRTSVGHQCRSVSSDRGETWGPVETVIEMVSPVSPVTVKRIPSTGHLLAIFNKTFDPLCTHGACHMGWRTPLTATVSLDDGQSWSLLRNVENDPKLSFDYVSIAMLEGDEVLLTYHWTRFYSASRTDWRRHLKLKILPVQWFYEDSGTGQTAFPVWPANVSWPPQSSAPQKI